MNQGAILIVTAAISNEQKQRINKVIDQLGKAARPAVKNAISKATYEARNVAVRAVPVYMGALKQSIEAEVGETVGRVMTPLNYAAAVEFGSRPHRVPLAPLIRYVYLKLGIPEDEAFPVARAIQKRIAQRGTKPKPYMLPAYDHARAVFPKYLETALANAVREAKQ